MNRTLTLHEVLVLDALFNCEAAVTAETLLEIADPREKENLTAADLDEALVSLFDEALILRVIEPNCAPMYSITAKGKARLVGKEAKEVFDECAPHARFVATCCRHREPKEPSTALLCLDEDELDDWWESLDVELKADAFTNFALRMHTGEDSHVYIEPEHPSIPVLGTVGETAEEWNAKAARINGAAVPEFSAKACEYCGGDDHVRRLVRPVGGSVDFAAYVCCQTKCFEKFQSMAVSK
jgi:hypothetical protein